MKVCNQCNRTYEDSAAFCPVCGKALITYQDTPSNAGRQDVAYEISAGKKKGNPFTELKQKVLEFEAQPEGYKKWIGTFLTLIGLALTWWIDAVFGFAFAVTGMLAGWWSTNGANKAISMIVGSITAFLAIITLLS